MNLSKPPPLTTARHSRRLRLLFATAALVALASFACPSHAREAALKVLVGTSVADNALGTIAPPLWHKYVLASLGGYQVLPFEGPSVPTLDDCRRAGAEYVLQALFELRPQLPGLPNAASGRIAARARERVIDCVSGDVVADKIVDFESDPPSGAPDPDATPIGPWDREIPATLARRRIVLERPARIVFVAQPLAHVNFRGATLHPGDVLQDVANARNVHRAQPIVLTVTQVYDDYVEVIFDASGDHPNVGDLVER
jgi:hypothetical protein